MAFPKREDEQRREEIRRDEDLRRDDDVERGRPGEQRLRPEEQKLRVVQHEAVEERPVSLVNQEEAARLRERWKSIQTQFVDEPRGAVKEADALVADVIRRITDSFTGERTRLEQQWSRGDDVSTEDLRVAMQHYRSFFDRLLSH